VSAGWRGALAVIVAVFCGLVASAQAPDTFVATASVKKGQSGATAPVRLSITRYANDSERAAVMKALKDGGTSGLREALSKMGDAGFIELGERRTALKFAGQRNTGSGRLLTVVTAEPILFLGAGLPAAKPQAGYDVAVAIIEVKEGGVGVGDLSPAAKVKLDASGALVVDDYGSTVIWLNGITRAK
jgi:hypothetical protein